MQGHDVASTLRRRYIYVMCPLGLFQFVSDRAMTFTAYFPLNTLILGMLSKNFSGRHFEIFSLFFSWKRALTSHANCLHRRQFAWNVKSYFLGKIRKISSNLSFVESAQRVVKSNISLSKFFEPAHTTKPTIRLVWPVKTQISLCIHAVWSESLICLLQPPDYPRRIKETLAIPGGCTGWPESLLVTQVLL